MNFLKLTESKLDLNDINSLVVHETCGGVSFFVGTTRDSFEEKKVSDNIHTNDKFIKKIVSKDSTTPNRPNLFEDDTFSYQINQTTVRKVPTASLNTIFNSAHKIAYQS